MIYLYIGLGILALWLLNKLFMVPKMGNVTLVTGAVKAGKSTLAVHLAKKLYGKIYFKWWIGDKIFYPVLSKLPKIGKKLKRKEKPLFYSNVPIVCKNYSPLTSELILRQHRFAYGSVVYVNEASLLADSQLIKDMDINERLQLFNKLFGHETKGGYLLYDTQSVNDNHYACKRCITSYFHVHHNVKIPFFVIMYVREMYYSDDGAIVNVSETTVEDTLKRVIVPKSVWKCFDAYCFSCFTDDLPVDNKIVQYKKNGDLKARKIVSFRTFKSLREEFVDNEKFKK